MCTVALRGKLNKGTNERWEKDGRNERKTKKEYQDTWRKTESFPSLGAHYLNIELEIILIFVTRMCVCEMLQCRVATAAWGDNTHTRVQQKKKKKRGLIRLISVDTDPWKYSHICLDTTDTISSGHLLLSNYYCINCLIDKKEFSPI